MNKLDTDRSRQMSSDSTSPFLHLSVLQLLEQSAHQNVECVSTLQLQLALRV